MQSCAFFVQQSAYPIAEQPELRKLSYLILANFSTLALSEDTGQTQGQKWMKCSANNWKHIPKLVSDLKFTKARAWLASLRTLVEV